MPGDDRWLSAGESAILAGLRFPRRRASFRLGRWTAKRAVARWRERPDDPALLAAIDVRRASDGAPEPYLDDAPAPVSLSLSDRAGVAVAVVGPAGLPLGCDLERVEPRTAAFVADYFTPAEQALVVAAATADRDERVTLVWSAKESALKALRTGLRRDTRSVVVTIPDEPASRGWCPLIVTAVEGTTFPGRWLRAAGFVVTVVTGRRTPPPRPLLPEDAILGALSSSRS